MIIKSRNNLKRKIKIPQNKQIKSNTLQSTNNTISFDINHQLKNKISIFSKFNYQQIQNKDNKKIIEKEKGVQINKIMKTLFNLTQSGKIVKNRNKNKNVDNNNNNDNKNNNNNNDKNNNNNNNNNKNNNDNTKSNNNNNKRTNYNKKIGVVDELQGIKMQRRQRFKKSNNPLNFIKYFINQRSNIQPTLNETFLIQKLISIRTQLDTNINNFYINNNNNINLDLILKKIYQVMNMAVDLNQLLFFILLIILCADISLHCKDYQRALYFYNQTRLASTYSNKINIKIESLIGMGQVSLQMKLYKESILFFKKSLQYSWWITNHQTELLCYDLLAQCYYYQGIIKQAQYYHLRFIQGQIEINSSALKKISAEMIQEYFKQLYTFEEINITSLFIQYLDLPITNFQIIPQTKLPQVCLRNPSSSSTNGPYKQLTLQPSARRNKINKQFTQSKFKKVQYQLQILFTKDNQFQNQLPQPNIQINFISIQKYSNKKKIGEFEKSLQYHKIMDKKNNLLKQQQRNRLFPLNDKINKILCQKINLNWWQDILHKIRKNRSQKLGKLRNRIQISHQSYNKYADQRRKCISFRQNKIKQSFNKTLLDWIDPIK